MTEPDNIAEPPEKPSGFLSIIKNVIKSGFGLAGKLANRLGGRKNETDRVLLLFSNFVVFLGFINALVLIIWCLYLGMRIFDSGLNVPTYGFLGIFGSSIFLLTLAVIPTLMRLSDIERIRALENKMDRVL